MSFHNMAAGGIPHRLLKALGLLCVASLAHAEGGGAPGVNPKDNVTKAEVFFKSDRLDGAASLRAVAVKYDRAFSAANGVNIELPWVQVSSPGSTVSGMGDIALRARHVASDGPWSVLAAIETVMPTASRDELGSGKWQLNPAIGLVYALSETSFIYAGYRHAFSVAGDSHRQDISDMQPRVLFARVWEQGYWAMADLKLTKSLKGSRQETLDLEFEAGTMLSRDIGGWVRIGTSGLDSPRRTGVLVGLRRLW